MEVAPPVPEQLLPLHFMFAVDGVPLPEPVVVELLDDRVPLSCAALRGRTASLEGELVAAVATGSRVDVGVEPAPARGELEDTRLRHDAPGTVSLRGSRVTFALAACAALDGLQQVVGRVTSGLATLHALASLEAVCGQPARRALVCSCGVYAPSSSRSLAVAAAATAQQKERALAERAETPAETRSRLALESEAARGAVSAAVQDWLDARPAKRARATEDAARRPGMLDSLLGGSDSEE